MNQLSEEQQERLNQIREWQASRQKIVDGARRGAFKLDESHPEIRMHGYIDFLLTLLDSDSEAAAHGPSNLLRRLKDFLFENCDHSDRDRNYDWCPSCVMGFMEVVAQPSNADSATAMRDKCVEKVREYLTDCRDEERGIIEASAAELSSLTLDQVKPEKQK